MIMTVRRITADNRWYRYGQSIILARGQLAEYCVESWPVARLGVPTQCRWARCRLPITSPSVAATRIQRYLFTAWWRVGGEGGRGITSKRARDRQPVFVRQLFQRQRRTGGWTTACVRDCHPSSTLYSVLRPLSLVVLIAVAHSSYWGVFVSV